MCSNKQYQSYYSLGAPPGLIQGKPL